MVRPGLLLACALLTLQALAIPAAAADPGQRDIRDIRGPVQMQFLPPFAMTGGMTLLLAGMLLGLSYLRRRARRPGVSDMPEAVKHGPDTADLLARLSEDFRQGRCAGDAAIARLDALLRNEIEIRADIPARQSTSHELSGRVDQSVRLDAETRAMLERFLALSDRVKFSTYRPSDADVAAALDTVRTVFDRMPPRQPA